MGGMEPRDVSVVNAHATSTSVGDVAECRAISAVFGDHARQLLHVVSHKGSLGHLLGAAGAVESVAAVLSLRDQVIPPNATLEEADADCSSLVRLAGNSEIRGPVQAVLKNSFGFGGTNCSLLFVKSGTR